MPVLQVAEEDFRCAKGSCACQVHRIDALHQARCSTECERSPHHIRSFQQSRGSPCSVMASMRVAVFVACMAACAKFLVSGASRAQQSVHLPMSSHCFCGQTQRCGCGCSVRNRRIEKRFTSNRVAMIVHNYHGCAVTTSNPNQHQSVPRFSVRVSCRMRSQRFCRDRARLRALTWDIGISVAIWLKCFLPAVLPSSPAPCPSRVSSERRSRKQNLQRGSAAKVCQNSSSQRNRKK